MKSLLKTSFLAGLVAASVMAGCQSDDNRRAGSSNDGIYATPNDSSDRNDPSYRNDPSHRDDDRDLPGINPATRPGSVDRPGSGSGPGSPGYGNPPTDDRIGEPLR